MALKLPKYKLLLQVIQQLINPKFDYHTLVNLYSPIIEIPNQKLSVKDLKIDIAKLILIILY